MENLKVRQVIESKGSGKLFTIRENCTLREMVRIACEMKIGALLVADEEENLLGIVSERDIVRHLHTDGAALLEAPVHRIMTAEVHTCVPEDSLDDLESAMTEKRFRHVPVLSDGKLVAIVSIGDVVKNRIDDLQAERDQLRTYIQS